jgi:hypothetical protein
MDSPEVSHGRRALGEGGTRTDSLIIVVNGCHTKGIRDHTYVVLSDSPLQGVY